VLLADSVHEASTTSGLPEESQVARHQPLEQKDCRKDEHTRYAPSHHTNDSSRLSAPRR